MNRLMRSSSRDRSRGGPRCPRCDASLPSDTPDGNCPSCLLRAALALSPAQPMTTPPSPSPPLSFGGYDLLEEAGRGGMGVVYKARQKGLDRIVAVKMLLFGAFSRPEQVERFRAEASAAAALQHPNIVAIHEVGEHAGQPFFSMDYVEGCSLSELARDRPLAPARAAAYLQTIATAVHYAHQQGVLHRDLKPSNILIDHADQPRITDFGLAKRFGVGGPRPPSDRESERSAPTSLTPDLTIPGQVLGSPNYIPPEQAGATGARVGPRSDVYALGAILYHLVAGRPPFAADSFQQTLRQVLENEPAPPRLLNPAVPRDLETICQKCLEKDPAARYGSAAELAEELGRFLRRQPILARPVGVLSRLDRWRQRQPALAAALAGVLVLLLLLSLGALMAAVRIQRSRRSETIERAKALAAARELQQSNRRLSGTIDHLELQHAEEQFTAGDDASGLAWLAGVLRRSPGNPVAAERLWSALLYRSFALPLGPPLRHASNVVDVAFSSDGRTVVTASDDGTAQIWEAHADSPPVWTLRHSGYVWSARFSPDDRWVVTASADHTARVWDARTGLPLVEALHHDGPVWTARFSPDGRLIATASMDGTARLWDSRTGRLLFTLAGHSGEVRDAEFSPDGNLVATAGGDGTVRVWDARTGKERGRPLPHGALVRRVGFSPDSLRVVTASDDGAARIWDARSLALMVPLLRHHGPVITAEFSPDGLRVATASDDRTACIWEAATGRRLAEPMRHADGLYGAWHSPDGETIVTACMDYTARLWNARTGAPLSQWMRRLGAVEKGAFSPDGRTLTTASHDGTAQLWDLRPTCSRPVVLRHEDRVQHAEFNRRADRVVTASLDDTAQVWDARTGQPIGARLRHGGDVLCARFSRDGLTVVTASQDRTARVWTADAGQPVLPPLPHPAPLWDAAFSPDDSLVATAAMDGSVRLWSVKDGACLRVIAAHDRMARSVRFSPDGQCVVSAGWDGAAAVWQVETGQLAAPRFKHLDRLDSAVFSPDGRHILTASADDTAIVWDARTGQQLLPALTHGRWVQTAQFSPDARWIATASWDSTARVWDAATGELRSQLPHARRVWSAAFSPDGQRVVTASWDGTARVWDAQTGEAVSEPLRHDDLVWNVQFSPDGQRVVTASSDRTARVWETPRSTAPIPDWAPALAEAAAGFRWTQRRAIEPVMWQELERLRAQVKASAQADAAVEIAQRFLAPRSQPSAPPPRRARPSLAGPAGLDIPERDSKTPDDALDLSSYYNESLDDGWENRLIPGNNLSSLPHGLQRLGGVAFDVRGVIRLYGLNMAPHGLAFPARVPNLRVDRHCRRLHFLQGVCWDAPDGTKVGAYLVRYSDGEEVEIPLRYGEDVRNWWIGPDPKRLAAHASEAWTGSNSAAAIRLFRMSWENPRPAQRIAAVDFESSLTACAPFLVAITAE